MKKLFKLFLISTFFSYYLVAVALNFPWINEHFDLLEKFNLKHSIQLNKNLYIGTYPDSEDLQKYQQELGVEQVITLLDPNFPLSKELIKTEKEQCKKLGIDLIIIPIPFFSKKLVDYMIIRNLLDEVGRVTYIHAYYFDDRMKLLKKVLQRYQSISDREGNVSRRSK